MAVAVASCIPTPVPLFSVNMQQPPVGIQRLPATRAGSERKELMNCKSCRRRKIKCDRVQPSCEACQVFRSECIYDAVPKKRGPKPDAAENSKRPKSLEKRSNQARKASSIETEASSTDRRSIERPGASSESSNSEDMPHEPTLRMEQSQPVQRTESATSTHRQSDIPFMQEILTTFFDQLHEKPFFILDQRATNQRMRDGVLPHFMIKALIAVTIRFVPSLSTDYVSAARSSIESADQSRAEIDVDEPTIDHLQSLLLLTMASFQSGKGKKAYMLLSHATTMATALNLHCELPPQLIVTSAERESRRKLFWTCYLMDRFHSTGSKRPQFLADDSIKLRLPKWQLNVSSPWLDNNYFSTASEPFKVSRNGSAGSGSDVALIEISRILGIANRYLATGGFRGDSLFPWHEHSALSKIRVQLDSWASSAQDAFSSIPTLFGQQESTNWVLAKLIYHVIHCLVYRPFLPLDLQKLRESGESTSWQVEAVRCCFLHANAISELIEIGQTSIPCWPPFASYCVFTAATVHVYGTHYSQTFGETVFNRSAELLSRGTGVLQHIRRGWACVQSQLDTLQTVWSSHSQLLTEQNTDFTKSAYDSGDFFERYSKMHVDPAYVTFAEAPAIASVEVPAKQGGSKDQAGQWRQPNFSFHKARSPVFPTSNKQKATAAQQKSNADSSNSFSSQPGLSTEDMRATSAEQDTQRVSPDKQELCSHLERYSISAQPQQHSRNDDFLMSPADTSGGMLPNHLSPVPYDLAFGHHSITSNASPGVGSTVNQTMQDMQQEEQDQFLSLLEQMASHESACTGFSELEYYLSKTG